MSISMPTRRTFSVISVYYYISVKKNKFDYKVLLIYQKLLVTKLIATWWLAKYLLVYDKNELIFEFVNVINFPDVLWGNIMVF